VHPLPEKETGDDQQYWKPQKMNAHLKGAIPMFKKLTAIAILVISIPVAAYAGAWTLNTWARSAGGTISVNGSTPGYRVTDGSQFANFSTQTVSVTIKPDIGYTARFFKDLIGNTSSETATGTATNSSPTTISISGTDATLTGSIASLWAVFTQTTIPVTATTDGTYTVNLTNVPFVYPGTVSPRNIVFTFTAQPGYVISAVTDAPATGITLTGLGSSVAYVTITKGYTFSTALSFVATATATTTPTTATPSAGPAQTIVNGHTATLTGSSIGTTVTSSNWSSIAIPTGATQPTLTPSGTNATTSALTTNGTYVFQYTVNYAGGTASAKTSVTVLTYATPVVTSLSVGRACQNCHTANGIAATNIYSSYSSSVHNSPYSGCTACHLGTGSGGHPGTLNANTVDNGKNFLVIIGTQAASEGTAAPGTVFCTACHSGQHPIAHNVYNLPVTCVSCHTSNNGDAHSLQNTAYLYNNVAGCVDCHAVAQPAKTGGVNDNNGVRAITGANGEFEATARNNTMGYRSHHIYNGTGVDPKNAQCLACHLEGKVGPGRTVLIDQTYHMADAQVHLRSGNTAISQNFAWDPANPDHTGMDNFCMSCHGPAGAVTAYANISSALKGAGLPGTPSAKNPFGDKLTNAYDQKVRPGVVDVYTQMDPSNPSHHAVRGAKYSGRSRYTSPGAGEANRGFASQTAFTQYSGAAIGTDIHLLNNGLPIGVTGRTTTTQYNVVGQPATFVLFPYQIYGSYSTSNGPASGVGPNSYPGSRQTLYDAGFFVATYTTLDGATLGDDSTLHCGDCHSVGQWTNGSAKAITWNNTSTASGGSNIISTTAVIGAHGSQNEYMLRTSNGTDSLQKQSSVGKVPKVYTNGTYVCFLCHKQELYGDNARAVTTTVLGTGQPAESNTEDEHGGNLYVGGCNGAAYSGYGKIGTARYGVLISGTSQPGMGNLFAMSCAHCHNSGQQNFGGIHGATGAYMSYSTNGTDVSGNATADGTVAVKLNVTHKTSYRFMGGESNRYNGGATADKWEAQTVSAPHREGCYNLSQTSDATHLWNTTAPMTTKAGSIQAIQNNGGSDSAWGATDYSTDLTGRYGQNNATSGWGSCNHHQGSTTTGPTAPARVIQRPLVY
jgi:hypothetical protein